MTKMKGGFLLNDTHESKTIEDAIEFFKKNSTFSILTNSSRACITFKAVLKASIDSPFIQIRSGIIEQPVTTLLFKYFPINTLNPNTEILLFTHAHRGGFPFIPLAHISDIQKEYDIQLQVYQTTYNTISSAYEPVCPYPIHCFTDLDKNTTIQEIIDKLDNTDPNKNSNILIITDTLGGAINSLITDIDEAGIDKAYIKITPINAAKKIIKYRNARANISTLGCIVMEFMDGYTTLYDYLNRCHDIRLIEDPKSKKEKFIEAFGQSEYDKYKQNFVPLEPGEYGEYGEYGEDKAFYEIYDKVSKKAKSLAAYELVRLKQIGFIHDDLHDENFMYNPNYKYITNDDKDVEHKGRALIIDFGESLINKKKLEDEEKEFYIFNKGVENVYERRGSSRKFSSPYTFEEIYRRRLDVTLAFREIMIQGLETMLDKFNKLTTEEEKTKFIQDKKIQLKLGLITNLKWPTNFVNPIVSDFNRVEFNEQFQKVQIPIFETSNKKIQTLTQKRDEIIPKVQALIELKEPESESTKNLETKATKAFNRFTYLTNKFKTKFTNLFSPSQSVHVGGRYITSHKTHNDFANRLDGRIRTTLRIKRRKQTKRRKRGKRSKKGKRSKRKQ
jgi:serine/threonine protein kinase